MSCPTGRHGQFNGVIVSGIGNTIGGTAAPDNVISGNRRNGVVVNALGGPTSSRGNFIEGDYIGTDPTGTAILANANNGIFVLGSNNVIGVQPNPLEKPERYRNVISGNGSNGVYVYGRPPRFP